MYLSGTQNRCGCGSLCEPLQRSISRTQFLNNNRGGLSKELEMANRVSALEAITP